MELASPCRIYIHHFRDFSSSYCCKLLLECLIQYDFVSWPFCFIALEAVMPASVLQRYLYISSLSSVRGASVSTGEFVRQAICMVVQSRFLDQNLFPLWPWERHWAGFLTRYRWLISIPLTTCKHLLCKLFRREFQLPGHRCLCQDVMRHTSQSPALCFQQLPRMLGGTWWFAAA